MKVVETELLPEPGQDITDAKREAMIYALQNNVAVVFSHNGKLYRCSADGLLKWWRTEKQEVI